MLLVGEQEHVAILLRHHLNMVISDRTTNTWGLIRDPPIFILDF